jgi:hypothetical protein
MSLGLATTGGKYFERLTSVPKRRRFGDYWGEDMKIIFSRELR